MRRTITDTLLAELNTLHGFAMRDIGYSYYADIKGDGRNIRSVYTIINAGGGVTYSPLNASTSHQTCRNIREAIVKRRLRIAAEAQASGLDQKYG